MTNLRNKGGMMVLVIGYVTPVVPKPFRLAAPHKWQI